MKKISKSDLIEFMKDQVSRECEVPRERIDIHVPFINYNMDSLKAVFIMDQLEQYLDEELSPLYFWDNPTIASFADFIDAEIINKKQ